MSYLPSSSLFLSPDISCETEHTADVPVGLLDWQLHTCRPITAGITTRSQWLTAADGVAPGHLQRPQARSLRGPRVRLLPKMTRPRPENVILTDWHRRVIVTIKLNPLDRRAFR